MRGNHFLETQSRASHNRKDVTRRATPPDQPRSGGGTCANYHTVRCSFGAITGSFNWALILETDRSTIASGTFTIGTTTTADLQTALSGVTDGPEVCPVYGGPLPSSAMTVHPNRGRGSTRWSFQITSQTVSPPGGSTLPAFVTSDPCCVVGG